MLDVTLRHHLGKYAPLGGVGLAVQVSNGPADELQRLIAPAVLRPKLLRTPQYLFRFAVCRDDSVSVLCREQRLEMRRASHQQALRLNPLIVMFLTPAFLMSVPHRQADRNCL